MHIFYCSLMLIKCDVNMLVLIIRQWLNNREILEHEGGDLPFEVDITKEVRIINSLHRRNSHRLTVAVNNTLLFSLPRNSENKRK